jgi:hypothetical protein
MSGFRLRPELVAGGLALLAGFWFAFAALWGCAEIPGGGHLGGGTVATAIHVLPMLKWHILYPSSDTFATSPPSPSSFYCHHPYGVFYAAALVMGLFGQHDATARLATILMSMAIPPLLYSIGKKHWGAAVGAVAAASYVVVPLAVGYSNYLNLETICIFGMLLCFWGLSHERLAASVAGASFAFLGDWIGYLLIAPLLAWAFLRAFVLPLQWSPPIRLRWYTRWWAVLVVVGAASLLFTLGLFYKADKLGEWLASGEGRGGGGDAPLAAVLASRKDWIDFSFTPLCVELGKIALPVCIARALWLRRDAEIYALCALFGATLQYVAFKRGADVHIFWPHYFAAYFALAMAQLAATLDAALRRAALVMPAILGHGAASWAALALGVTPAVLMAPDAVRSLPLWRGTGGRYDNHGSPVRSEIDLLTVVRHVIAPRVPVGGTLDQHPTVPMSYEHRWAAMRQPHQATDPEVAAPGASTHPIWFARPSVLSAQDIVRIAAKAHVRAYGDAWVVDQREGPGPIDAWPVWESRPRGLDWLLFGGWEPLRKVASEGPPSPLQTWEWRVHLGQPTDAPSLSKEERPAGGGSISLADALDVDRTLHNAAVSAGELAQAEALSQHILSQLDRTMGAQFEQGLRLVGVRRADDVQPRLEVWLQAGGPLSAQAQLTVRSAIDAPSRWSLVPASGTEQDLGVLPPKISTRLWRSGFLYRIIVVLNHRIGRERYWAFWSSLDGGAAPQRVDGQPFTVLAVVP